MTLTERILRCVFFRPIAAAEQREQRLQEANRDLRNGHALVLQEVRNFNGSSVRFMKAKEDLIHQDMLDLAASISESLHE